MKCEIVSKCLYWRNDSSNENWQKKDKSFKIRAINLRATPRQAAKSFKNNFADRLVPDAQIAVHARSIQYLPVCIQSAMSQISRYYSA